MQQNHGIADADAFVLVRGRAATVAKRCDIEYRSQVLHPAVMALLLIELKNKK